MISDYSGGAPDWLDNWTGVRIDSGDPMKVGEMVMNAAHQRGLYMRAIGDRLQLMPPLIISRSESDELVAIFKAALDDAWLQVSRRGS